MRTTERRSLQKGPFQKERIVFQASLFRGKLFISGRVCDFVIDVLLFGINSLHEDVWPIHPLLRFNCGTFQRK